MIDNQNRIGNLTSSNIYKICASLKNGNPSEAFYTYVKEKMYERSLGRSLEMGVYSKSMAWGKFLEKRVFDNLSQEYQMVHKTTYVHQKHIWRAGSPDFIVPKSKVSELKCFEPKNFSSYVSALLTRDTERIKSEHPKEYWQIVQNADILRMTKGEAIVYMPYESEMKDIRELTQDLDYLNQINMLPWEVFFINEKSNSELAVLPDNSKFENLNIIEFEIPSEDVYFLHKRSLQAGKILEPNLFDEKGNLIKSEKLLSNE